MSDQHKETHFTGEYFVPGKAGDRLEADHVERYRFACRFAQGKSVLDIACGVGYAAPEFIHAGATGYLGVDLGQLQIDHARREYGSDLVRFEVGNICTFGDGQNYDLITCFETIEHVDSYLDALANLSRLLKPGGKLFISSPNRPVTSPKTKSLGDKPSNRFHTQEFTPGELLTLLRDHGLVASDADVYGQRQGRIYKNRAATRLAKLIFGDPKKKASAAVEPIAGKVPRYFVIVATKPETAVTCPATNKKRP